MYDFLQKISNNGRGVREGGGGVLKTYETSQIWRNNLMDFGSKAIQPRVWRVGDSRLGY